jgi:hypothetical protein
VLHQQLINLKKGAVPPFTNPLIISVKSTLSFFFLKNYYKQHQAFFNKLQCKIIVFCITKLFVSRETHLIIDLCIISRYLLPSLADRTYQTIKAVSGRVIIKHQTNFITNLAIVIFRHDLFLF